MVVSKMFTMKGGLDNSRLLLGGFGPRQKPGLGEFAEPSAAAQYEKRAVRFLKRHSELEKQYLKTLQLLEMNRTTPRYVCIP